MRYPQVEKDIKTLKQLQSERNPLEAELDEIGNIFAPGTQSFSDSGRMFQLSDEFIDDWGIFYKQELVAYLFAQATNPATKFLRFNLSDAREDKKLSKASRDELELINERVLSVFASASSNFITAIQQTLESGITFGPGILHLQNDFGKNISFRSIPLAQVYIRENSKGKVDSIFRVFEFTARQLVQEYGEGGVSKEVLETSKDQPEQKFKILHVVEPIPGAIEYNKQYRYAVSEIKNIHPLEEKQLSYNCFKVFRWNSHVGEKYGFGQGKLALKAVRKLSAIGEENILAQRLANRPPLVVANEGVLMDDNMDPGSIHVGIGAQDGRELIKPMNLGISPQNGNFMYEQQKELLSKFFFSEKLSTPEDKTRRTAFEIDKIDYNHLRFLSPYAARLLDELLKPTAIDVFRLLTENGEFSDLQTDIMKYDLEPEFLGPVSQLLKMEDVRAAQNMLNIILPLAQLDPNIPHRINMGEYVELVRKGTGTPSNILVDPAQYEQNVAAQAQQQQQLIAGQTALNASQVAANVGQANKFNAGV